MIVEAGFGILIGVGIASAVFAYHSKENQTGVDSGLPAVKNIVSTSGVKPQKHSISEPVISFVECVKKNPRRFSTDKVVIKLFGRAEKYTITDKDTLEVYCVTFTDFGIPHKPWSSPHVRGYPKFLTEVEALHVLIEVKEVYEQRKERYKELKNQRERRRLTKIYKESV